MKQTELNGGGWNIFKQIIRTKSSCWVETSQIYCLAKDWFYFQWSSRFSVEKQNSIYCFIQFTIVLNKDADMSMNHWDDQMIILQQMSYPRWKPSLCWFRYLCPWVSGCLTWMTAEINLRANYGQNTNTSLVWQIMTKL